MADHGPANTRNSRKQQEPPRRWTRAIDDDLGLSPRLADAPPPKAPDPEEPWTRQEKPTHGRPIFLMATVATFLLVIAVFLFIKLSPSQPASPVAPTDRTAPSGQPFMERASAAEIRRSTETTVRGFMNASNFADRCQYVVGGKDIEERMREFYQRPNNPIPNGFGRILDVQPSAFAGLPMQIVSAAESNEHSGWIFNMLPSSDRMLIDWESSVAYGELSWPDFLNKQPRQPTAMRVYLKRCHRYIEPFTDESIYEAFEITARGFSERVFGYVRRDSDLHSQLQFAVPIGASQPVHAILQWNSQDPESLSVEITALKHNFWIDPERARLTASTPQP